MTCIRRFSTQLPRLKIRACLVLGSDLWGGTFNQISRVLEEEGKEDWVVVLALTSQCLCSLWLSWREMLQAEVAKGAQARMGVKVRQRKSEATRGSTYDVLLLQRHLNSCEGTVIGDSNKIVLARIDAIFCMVRLQLRGQR